VIGWNSPSVPRGCPWFLAGCSFPTWLKAREGETQENQVLRYYM